MYTHQIAFFKKTKRLGWISCDFRTTHDALKLHLSSLYKMQTSGTVRAIDVTKIANGYTRQH